MTMLDYLTIEQAIKYVTSKIDYEFSFENLKDLEAFQIIQPVFFFEGLAKFHYMETVGITEIGGYFKLHSSESLISKEDIYFEKCFLYAPTLDDFDCFSDDIEVRLSLEKSAKESNTTQLLKWIRGNGYVEINPYHYSFYLYELDNDGSEVIKSVIKPHDVRVKKSEIDEWLTENITGDKVHSLKARISELEQLLEQTGQTQIDEGQGDTFLILGAVMECIKEVAKPNYTQQALIDVITTTYPNITSLSESTLKKKFPKAKNYLKQRLNL